MTWFVAAPTWLSFFYQKFDLHFTVTEIAVTMPKDKVLESHQFTSELEFS